ncbi:glycosyltransferase family protein [Marinigracilibium pacificum]|uniref:Glycosyl transferase n=1 Tax=Marinigracilibium pacificum TaxID=2729599 RepID=A0A848IR55_9BACT|nr:glycosyltransferase family protein [Marinigracilibium pacificum]NMM46837.1 glycosyl transferase [Marinigracilibium pacificum]
MKKPKVLYAIQGTGNGHIARARDLVPKFAQFLDLDVLISGNHCEVKLNHPVKYQMQGFGFYFGKNGGIDWRKTIRKNNIRKFISEILKFDINQYDYIINDFEPVSAWAGKLSGVPVINLSHQAAVIANESPKPKYKDYTGLAILKYYAPSQVSFGFHFKEYNETIQTPIIREEIRKIKPSSKNHFTVYLPAIGDRKIIKILNRVNTKASWEVFSKHTTEAYEVNSIRIFPINNEKFIESLASCRGIICGAGFESVAEACFLGKKILAIPMKGQYEQALNAAAIKDIGHKTLKSFRRKYISEINKWVISKTPAAINYPDNSYKVVNQVIWYAQNNIIDKNEAVLSGRYSFEQPVINAG